MEEQVLYKRIEPTVPLLLDVQLLVSLMFVASLLQDGRQGGVCHS
jgi:hypothetical protein